MGASSTRDGVTGDGGGGQLTLANISHRREGRPHPNRGVYDKVEGGEDGVVGKQRRRIPTTRPLSLPLHTPFLLLVLVATTLMHQIREDAMQSYIFYIRSYKMGISGWNRKVLT